MGSLLFFWSCAPKNIYIPPPPPPPTRKVMVDKAPKRTMIMMAWYHTHRREWYKAETFFSQAHQIAPDDPWIFVSWGDAAHHVSQVERAIWAWEQALAKTTPSDIDVRVELYRKLDQYR